MLSQLIYLSTRNPKCSNNDIMSILEKSRLNNKAKGITGVLLYSKDKFLQVIEGEYTYVDTLYKVIEKDERHIEPVLISFSPVQMKNFPSWEMGSKDIDNSKTYKIVSIEEEGLQEEFKAILEGKTTKMPAIKIINTLF